MGLIYGIPSYHRPECRTVKTLLNAGIEPERIVVSLQDKSDVATYREKYPSVRFIFRETDCASGNRNTLLENIDARPICLLDDDIRGFSMFSGENFRTNTAQGIREIERLALGLARGGGIFSRRGIGYY